MEEVPDSAPGLPATTSGRPFIKLCEQFGLTQADSPYVDMDPKQAAVLIRGARAGQAKIDELMRNVHATPEGWQSALHIFDYNLDYFEIGTVDRPEWKIADRKQAYVTRAVAARGGLWGNHGYDTDYGLIWVDADGDRSTGPSATSYASRRRRQSRRSGRSRCTDPLSSTSLPTLSIATRSVTASPGSSRANTAA